MRIPIAGIAALLAMLSGCAARSYYSGVSSYPGGASVARIEEAAFQSEAPTTTAMSMSAAPATYDFDADLVEGELVQPDASARRGGGGEQLAQATPAEPSATATDAVDTSGSLLIYTATLYLAVYEVAEAQARILRSARDAGGFVFAESDDSIVVRVPAPRFHPLLADIAQAGDLIHREVQAQDVSEEFHDVEIRIRNLEAMRARVEALLAQTHNIDEALRVEQQLHRITEELERLRGRQRFLADRIAFSTITVMFRPRPRESLGQSEIFELPFAWLENLGLSNLLNLR
jgi:hypothetical protein